MKSTKQLNKRSVSPLIPKTIEVSERKKKSNSNYPSNPYRHQIKEFQTYGKTEKKRNSNYLKDLLKNQESGNKYRIVTEPVDDRILHLASSSFGRISKSKNKGDCLELIDNPINFKVRNSSHSNQKLKLSDPHCKNCQKHKQELQTLKSQFNKVFMNKILWKNGSISLPDLKDQLCIDLSTGSSKNMQQHKSMEGLLTQMKRHFYDLMKEIESLTAIDYPKMLSLNIFQYEPTYSEQSDHQQTQIKSMLNQLRNTVEGKVNAWDLQEDNQDSEHTKTLMRNMKSRLNHYLRQNLQLKTKKAILERAQQISSQSQEYLRRVVQQVLASYTASK